MPVGPHRYEFTPRAHPIALRLLIGDFRVGRKRPPQSSSLQHNHNEEESGASVKTKEARNPNSRPEQTAGVTAFSPERVDKSGKVVAHPVGGYVYASYGKIWRGAVGNVARL